MAAVNHRVRLIFIRHAQSEANTTFETICGQSRACPLTPLGLQQAALLGKRFKYHKVNFDYLLCSTAVRAKLTADIALAAINVDPSKVIVSDALLEQSQGDWEGKNRFQCYNDEVMQRMKDLHIEFSAPNGESIRAVQKRTLAFLEPFIDEAKRRSVEENREVSMVIFTHANVVRAALQHFSQSEPRHAWLIGQANTGISEVLFNQHGTCISKVNDSGHLIFPIPDVIEQN